jgi:aryl-alcohol dehydrogenase-like predicted oxidoreductase
MLGRMANTDRLHVAFETIPMTKAFSLELVAWSPLADGLHSGKYHSADASGKRYSDKSLHVMAAITACGRFTAILGTR